MSEHFINVEDTGWFGIRMDWDGFPIREDEPEEPGERGEGG